MEKKNPHKFFRLSKKNLYDLLDWELPQSDIENRDIENRWNCITSFLVGMCAVFALGIQSKLTPEELSVAKWDILIAAAKKFEQIPYSVYQNFCSMCIKYQATSGCGTCYLSGDDHCCADHFAFLNMEDSTGYEEWIDAAIDFRKYLLREYKKHARGKK
jgi:hypothetical protein